MSHVLVICARRYNGHELWTALEVMMDRGHTFEVVSTQLQIADELTLRPNVISRKVYDVPNDEGFDGIMVVSGNMADTEAYWHDDHVVGLIKKFDAASKGIAAICCSVPTIAPVAAGKRVSFFPLIRSRDRLRNHGAILTTVTLSVDDRLVTAEHQMATQMWAEEFCNVLEGKPTQYTFHDSGYTPKGRPRWPPKEVQALIDQKNANANNKNNGNSSS
jgi:putative intracellular protease/amidase